MPVPGWDVPGNYYEPDVEEPEEKAMDKETIQTILDLINPLHGAIDQQTYDERYKQGFDAPADAEYDVTVTAQQERDLTQAVLILEARLRDLNMPPSKRAPGTNTSDAWRGEPPQKRPPASVEIAQRRASGLSLGQERGKADGEPEQFADYEGPSVADLLARGIKPR